MGVAETTKADHRPDGDGFWECSACGCRFIADYEPKPFCVSCKGREFKRINYPDGEWKEILGELMSIPHLHPLKWCLNNDPKAEYAYCTMSTPMIPDDLAPIELVCKAYGLRAYVMPFISVGKRYMVNDRSGASQIHMYVEVRPKEIHHGKWKDLKCGRNPGGFWVDYGNSLYVEVHKAGFGDPE